MTNSMLMLTKEQAFALMDWPFLDTLAPELVVYRDRLQGAVKELVKSTDKQSTCPPCVKKRYSRWEKSWMTQLHILFNKNESVGMMVEQFLLTSNTASTALAQHARLALGATQTVGKG